MFLVKAPQLGGDAKENKNGNVVRLQVVLIKCMCRKVMAYLKNTFHFTDEKRKWRKKQKICQKTQGC